jgi:NPCBM-associated, NEW3 domain of alpha-galactosidase
MAGLTLVGLMVSVAHAQSIPVTADRNLPVQWLLLKRAYLELRDTEQKLEDAEQAGRDRQAEALWSALERARLEYGAVLASLVPVVPRLVVTSAIKRQQAGQGLVVHIGLRSLPLEWPDALRRVSLPALEADLNSLSTIRGALVMIKNGTGTVIGLPFQATIESLKPGERATAQFRLQEAVSTIVVALNYAGRVEEYGVRLAAEGPAVRIDSAQVSQEADLGATAIYDLRIERTTPRTRILRLLTIGLPPQFRHEFMLDAKPGATRLSQYRFQDEELVRPMVLRIQIPEVLGDRDVALDAPIRFRARVVDASNQATDAKDLVAAEAELELIPRGVGRLTLQSPNFLVEGIEGSLIATRVEVRNVGSREVQVIKPTIEVPTGWTATVSPTALPLLRANEARSLDLLLQPGGAGAGDYTLKIRVGGGDSSRESTAAADLRVRVVGRGSVAGMLGFFGALLGLVATVTYFGARLARR